jgi:hypothetical protein
MTTENKAGFLGETLFHFLGTGDHDTLFDVFDSIVRRGFLMTVGNKDGKLDSVPVQTDRGVEIVELMQHARVCFTDIPEEMLSSHCKHYGMFGLGFRRSTILAWGGNPVIYVPNHPAAGTLESSMGAMLYCLHRIPLLMAALNACLKPGNASLKINETTLVGPARDHYIDQAQHSVRRMWSFVKEMSYQAENNYQYLYEREWRIVDGAVISGIEITRELSDDEFKELAAKRPRWTKPIDAGDGIMRQYPHKHMLQLFRFFNGLPGATVSQAIDVVLTPNDTLKQRVCKYIEANASRFRNPPPNVRVFGETGGDG